MTPANPGRYDAARAHLINQIGLSALMVAVLLASVGAVLFARADQVERIAADADELGRVQAVFAELAIHRASLVISFASATGIEDLEGAALEGSDEAVQRARRIGDLIGDMATPDVALPALAEQLLTSTTEVQNAIAEGDIERAVEVSQEETLPTGEELEAVLTNSAGTIAGRIAAEQAEAGRVARTMSLVVALLVPALVVTGFRVNTRRRLEREKLENEVVRERELTDAKEQLLAGLSHQLRTPLTGIYGYADLLLNRPSEDTIREGAHAMFAEAGDLRRMVEDILVTTRNQAASLEFRPVVTDISRVVERAAAHYQRLGVMVKLDCEPVRFPLDSGRVEHVIRNVVANAVKHGEQPIEITGVADGVEYLLSVTDSGSGVSTGLDDPFAPFTQSPGTVQIPSSLGLGLSVAKTLTEGMGGQIEYRRGDERSVFRLLLPMAGPHPPAVPEEFPT
jgi:signal transduction histidine kinase